MKAYDHPAMFPEALAERVVMKLFSFKGDVVLDPFMGVGTSPLVIKLRPYLGIAENLQYETRRKALRLS